MRSFGEVVTEIGRLLGRPDSVYRDHIKAAVNLAIQEYTAEFCTPYNARRRVITATGEAQQALPAEVDRPVWVLSVTDEVGLEPGLQWDRFYPGAFASELAGTPCQWQIDGVYPVTRHPRGAALTLDSGASDARAVVIQGTYTDTASSGLATEHVSVTERVYLTGQTAVTLSTAFDEITQIAVSSRHDAAVRLRLPGGEAIAVIEPQEVSTCYTWVRWLPVPAAGTRLMLGYIPRVPHLVDDDQGLPAHVPASYAIWAPLAQLAADMAKPELARLALLKTDKIVRGLRAKQLAFGDLDNQATPQPDAWTEDGI